MSYPHQEEVERHAVWLENKKYIENHNNNEEERGFTLALNQFADQVGTKKTYSGNYSSYR